MENKEFDFINDEVKKEENASKETPVSADDFKLVNREDYKLDQKFETKPTTFLKDSIKRFSKNKSSVVATWIVGILILLAIFVPIFDSSDLNSIKNNEQTYLEPKLFNAGSGFWDGTVEYTNIPYDSVTQSPSPDVFNKNAVVDLKVNDFTSFTDSYSLYGKGGYIRLNGYEDSEYENNIVFLKNVNATTDLNLNYKTTLEIETIEEDVEFFRFVPYQVKFSYVETVVDLEGNKTNKTNEIILKEFSSEYSKITLDLNNLIGNGIYAQPTFEIDINVTGQDTSKYYSSGILIKSLELKPTTEVASEEFNEYVSKITALNFTDANQMIGRTAKLEDGTTANPAFYTCSGNKNLYHAVITACSFRYDTYEAAFGRMEKIVDADTMRKFVRNKWIKYTTSNEIDPVTGTVPFTYEILNAKKCPIVEIKEVRMSIGSVNTKTFVCEVINYKLLGYSHMPRYIMGTDKSGKDMFKYVFEGLRTSLILGVVTSAICFVFGLCWGAICGYFGGNIDLAMERFTDILSGLPWIVIMTLCILHLGSNFGVFVLALCLTGWIGTAATTRTQFYRFKNREYVLASRTLGASNMRLIFKHILPNAMGTIITGAVLMIPSVIFSEATISYLGLGFTNLSSFGVILSDNQAELLQHPYLLIFPSVIIALLEISFNLFGNGLRDAINPTLKGEGE